METALSTISVLPSGREQVQLFTRKLKNEILADDKEPLKILAQLKYIEKTIADLLKDKELDYHFLKEFLLYDKAENVNINGIEFGQMETGVKYDYNASGDPKWMDLNKQITELTEKRKEREKFLQAIPMNEQGIVDSDSGVFITRPPKSSHTKVVCRFK